MGRVQHHHHLDLGMAPKADPWVAIGTRWGSPGPPVTVTLRTGGADISEVDGFVVLRDAGSADRRATGSGAGCGQRLGDDVHGLVDLRGGGDQRRDDPDDLAVRARRQQDQLAVERLAQDPLDDRRIRRQRDRRPSGSTNSSADHEPRPRTSPSRGCSDASPPEALEELLAARGARWPRDPRRSMTSSVARAAAHATTLPP